MPNNHFIYTLTGIFNDPLNGGKSAEDDLIYNMVFLFSTKGGTAKFARFDMFYRDLKVLMRFCGVADPQALKNEDFFCNSEDIEGTLSELVHVCHNNTNGAHEWRQALIIKVAQDLRANVTPDLMAFHSEIRRRAFIKLMREPDEMAFWLKELNSYGFGNFLIKNAGHAYNNGWAFEIRRGKNNIKIYTYRSSGKFQEYKP